LTLSSANEDEMSKVAMMLRVAFLCASVAGCGGRAYEGEQRFAISGTVTVDGQPLDFGVIAFKPQGMGENLKGRVAGSPIREGRYTIPEEKGPTAAAYRVEIHWNKKTGKQIPNPMDKEQMIDELMEGLPAKYHQDSVLTAEVSARQTTFNFDLKTN
jgi:hypothetical protein